MPGGFLCRGIVFTYENGGQRAVGDCRVRLDASVVYHFPRRFCVATTRAERSLSGVGVLPWVRVCFSLYLLPDHYRDGEDAGDWECYEMEGILMFWHVDTKWDMDVVQD